MSIGIIYVATGEKYVKEAGISAKMVRRQMPDVPITIFTDLTDKDLPPYFDETVHLSNPAHSFFDKIEPMVNSPYEKTLFLDTDALMIEPVYELFGLLDKFDLAYCHAPFRISYDLADVPDAFPEANTGVLAFQQSPAVQELFRNWAAIYKQHIALGDPPLHDQPAFRQALYLSEDIKSLVLAPEYNLRATFPFFAGGRVKILHGRGPFIVDAIKTINKNIIPRIGNFKPYNITQN